LNRSNRLTVESLEARDVPAWFYWVGDNDPATTGYLPWYTGSYWEGGVPPNNTTGADFVKIRAGADKIALAGDFAGITTTAGDHASVLVKDGNTLKIRDLEVYASATGRTNFTLESNTTVVLAGSISARGGVVVDNSNGLAGNTNLLIDNAGQPMPTIGLLDRDGLIVNGVNTTVTAGSALMLWGNNGADTGYIKFTSPTTNPATFTNNGNLYLTRRATVAFADDFFNYGGVALQSNSSIVSHVFNGATGVIDIPAGSVGSGARIGWSGTDNQDLDNHGLVKFEANGNIGPAALLLYGNRGTDQRGDYNDYGETRVYATASVTPPSIDVEAHAAVLSGNTVSFTETSGRGHLRFRLTDRMYVYGTTFNHTYDATLFDQADEVDVIAPVTLGNTPTFNVAGGPLQTPLSYVLLSATSITGTAQPGTIPDNARLKQGIFTVYLQRLTVVTGRFFTDGMLDSQNPANNVDMNALDDHPSAGAAYKTVWLYAADNPYSPAYTTTTDAAGNYAFADVAAGEYVFVFSSCQWYDVFGVYDNYAMNAPFVTTGDSDVDASGMLGIAVDESAQVLVNAGVYAVRL
jgi:hypothetical protein